MFNIYICIQNMKVLYEMHLNMKVLYEMHLNMKVLWYTWLKCYLVMQSSVSG